MKEHLKEEKNLSTTAQSLHMRTQAERFFFLQLREYSMRMICIDEDEDDGDEDISSAEAKANPRVWLSCDFSKGSKLFPQSSPQWKQFPHVKPQLASQSFP